MNLASRCREAISHVAMLKKELAMHQKQAQEAIRFQREQTQRMASNLSTEVSRLSASYSSENYSPESTPDRRAEMERVLATTPPPPPPPPRATVQASDNQKVSEESSNPRTVSPREDIGTVSNDSSEDDDTVHSISRKGRSVLDVVESLSESPPPKPESNTGPTLNNVLPPRMYSTPNRQRKGDRWTPHIDDAPGSIEKEKTLFPHTASPKVPNYNEEFPSDIMQVASSSSHHRSGISLGLDDDDDEDYTPSPTLLDRHSGFITMNSIDAFEASFDTAFPSNFSSSRRLSSEKEIYNPFDASPARSIPRSRKDTSPESFSPRAHFSTPPKERTPNKEAEPPRPQKTPSSEARSRYEKAMQPRSQEKSISTTDAVAPEKEKSGFLKGSSPSNFLKRIQKRRQSKDDGSSIEYSSSDGSPSNSSTKQENVAPTAQPQSQRAAPAAAELPLKNSTASSASNSKPEGRPGGMVARLHSLKQRRAVKQPVSYAEPSLNTKIRQGHTYFPKEPLRTVTPEQVASPSGT